MGAAWVAPYIHPSFRARTRWWLYFFFFRAPKGTGVGLPQGVIPDLVRPRPPVCSAGAYRAHEGAILPAGDAQSGDAGDWNLLVAADVIVHVHLVGADLGPTHQSTRMRSERWHDAAPMLRPVGYTGQTGCRRAGRWRNQRTSPRKDPSGQAHTGLL